MIEEIRSLRKATSMALADALRPLIEGEPSEVEIRDAFHSELDKLPGITDEGWYQPPPKGLIVNIGSPPDFQRIANPSFRPESTWPSSQHRLNDESLLYCYGARVQKSSGLISDLSCSLYRGSNQHVRQHLQEAWATTLEIAHSARVGMSLAEFHAQAMKAIEREGFENNVYSPSDPSGSNIGHTIPWTTESLSVEERRILEDSAPSQIADVVSKKRRFVSGVEPLEITPDLAFTVEPRLSRPGLPMVNFHVVVGFADAMPVVATEFDAVFDLFGMDWLSGS